MKSLCKLHQFRNILFFTADVRFNCIGYCLDIGRNFGRHDFAQGSFGRIGADVVFGLMIAHYAFSEAITTTNMVGAAISS